MIMALVIDIRLSIISMHEHANIYSIAVYSWLLLTFQYVHNVIIKRYEKTPYFIMINDKANRTIFSVVLKQDVYPVDVVRSTKIHHPPHCLVWTV